MLMWLMFIMMVIGVHKVDSIEMPSVTFTTEPEGKIQFLNTKGSTINCAASGTPTPNVNWTLIDGSPVTNVPGLREVTSSGTLVFHSFRAESFHPDIHSTTYRCVVSNSAGKIQSRDVNVRGVVQQVLDVQVYDSYAIEGNTAVFKCYIPTVQADYLKVTSWIKNDNLLIQPSLEDADEKYALMPYGELHIHNTTMDESSSRYKCKTVNLLSGESKISSSSGQLFLTKSLGNIASRIVPGPTSILVPSGQTAVLSCVPQGNPLPTIRWQKRTSTGELQPIDSRNGRIIQSKSGLLILKTIPSDSGVYSCEVENIVSQVQQEFNLTVIEYASAAIQSPVKQVKVGDRAAIKCEAMGHASISWLHNGVLIEGASDETFIVDSVRLADRGMYQCFVKNSLGDIAQATAELRLSEVAPRFVKTFEEVSIQPGGSVSLTCEAQGIPVPTISWHLDESLLKDDNGVRVLNSAIGTNGMVVGTLQLDKVSVEDGGLYSCVASNQGGDVIHSTKMNVYGSLGSRKDVNKFAVSGSNVFLNCPVYGYPIELISWEKDGQTIPFIVRHLLYTNGTLGIENVNKLADSGVYKCVASNEAGQMVQSEVNVAVMVPPKIVPFEFQDELLREGMRARLQCVVSEGDLPLTIKWLKDGQPLSPSLGVMVRVLDEFSSILTISSITPGHNGKYVCVASNRAATVFHIAELSVNVPPKIVPFSFQDDQLVEGQLARVSCVVSRGDLPLKLLWEKDGKGISTGELGIQIRSFDEHSSILSIASVSPEHNGHYVCIASNGAGSARHSAQLVVQVPPHWLRKPVNVGAINGDRVLLDCQADGFPKPIITWKQAKAATQDTVRTSMQNAHGIEIFTNGTLLIESIASINEGYYFCEASNGIGSGLSAVIAVKINSPPIFKEMENRIEGNVNAEIQLQCLAQGDTPINITWNKDNKVIQEGQIRYKIETTNTASDALSILTIYKVEKSEAGVYVCMAENKHGSNRTTVELVVKGIPEAPTGVRIASLNSRSVELAWEAPSNGNDFIKKYIIQFKKAEDFWESAITMETINGEPRNSIVSQLHPAVDYLFRLYAENAVGRGPASQILRITTHEDIPSGPPTDIQVEPVNTETFKVSWKAPEGSLWNGKILGFYVGYKEVDTEDPFLFKTLLTPNARAPHLAIQIGGLKQFTKYAVIVQAYNGKGTGPSSEPVIVMTSEGAPSLAPTFVHCTPLTSQSIHVTWTAPSSDSINGILSGYKVLYKPASDWFEDVAENYNISLSTSLTLNKLEKFSNYSIQVLAMTKAGSGPKSYPIFCKTLDDVPGSPMDIKAIATSDDSVIVAWKPPVNPNGVIRTYSVYWRNTATRKNEMHTVPALESSYEVIGLRKGHNYEFWVAASTAVGEGKASRTVSQEPTGPLVAAKMVSFDEKIITAWKSDISLLCQAVGLPEPTKTWLFKGKTIETSTKIDVSPEGILTIRDVQEEDAGDYVCQAQNKIGRDKVTYSIIVLAPPAAPLLEVVSMSSSAVEVKWKTPSSKMSRIKGYTLHLRRDVGEWKEITVGADVRSYLLDTLDCGTRYEIYMTAFNKIGMGAPSEILIASTKGSVPSPPNKADLIEEMSTSVSLYLNTWKSNGCPIHYFVVEYARKSTNDWTFVSDSIKPDQRRLVIPGLKTGTWYELRMTAHNSAGSSIAEYNFATLTLTGATISTEIQSDSANEAVDGLIAYLNFYVIIPICCTVIILLAILAAACVYLKLRSRPHREINDVLDNRMSTMSSQLKRGDSTGSFAYMQRGTLKHPAGHSKAMDDDLMPYATCKLVNHPFMMDTIGRHGMAPPPLPPPRNEMFQHCENPMPTNPDYFAHSSGCFTPIQNTSETTFIFPNLTNDEDFHCTGGYPNHDGVNLQHR